MSGNFENQGNCPRQLPVAWGQWVSVPKEEKARNKSKLPAFLFSQPILLPRDSFEEDLASLPICLHQPLLPS